MTGSSYVAIVVPIMAFTAMAFWLGLVFYADSHPGYGRRRSAKRLPSAPLQFPAAIEAVGPGEHEQIEDEVLAGQGS